MLDVSGWILLVVARKMLGVSGWVLLLVLMAWVLTGGPGTILVKHLTSDI
jgi:hypothetical protein